MIAIAKGKYQEWLTKDGLLRVEGWARDGLIDKQIAQNMGISSQTYYEWQKAYPELSDAIKKGKAPVDREVENALLKRALGFQYTETTEEIYTTGEKDANGQPVIKERHIRKVTKEMPPDTAAIFIWLKNRMPERWRDKPVINETQKAIDSMLSYAQILSSPQPNRSITDIEAEL